MFFPAVQPDSLPATPLAPVVKRSAGEASGSILLIEDEPAIARMLARLFAQAGLRVVAAADPTTGLGLLERSPEDFALAFVDCRWAELPASDFCRRVRAIRPRLPVLLAGGPDQPARSTAAGDERTLHVSRPYLPTELVWKVRALLAIPVA